MWAALAVWSLSHLYHLLLGSDGRRLAGLNVVRIGAGGRKERGVDDDFLAPPHGGPGTGTGGGAAAADVTQMARVVERLHLDYLADEKRRAQCSARAGGIGGDGGRVASVVEIKKNILDRADVVCSTLSGAGSQPILEVRERGGRERYM